MNELFKPLVQLASRFKGFTAFVSFTILVILALFIWAFSEGSFDQLITNFGRLSKEQFFILVIVVLVFAFSFSILLVVLSYRSSLPRTIGQAVVYVVVHEKNDETRFISDAIVKLALPEPVIKPTQQNGAVNFTVASHYIKQKVKINASRDGYVARIPQEIIIKDNLYVKIELERAESAPEKLDGDHKDDIVIPDYPYQNFSEEYRDIVSPKRYDNHILNMVFGSLSDIRNTTVVIPINQDFDFRQRGPRSVLASFENIIVDKEYLYDFFERTWMKSERPRQAGIGHTKYIRLPTNSQSIPGVIFVVTTRNMSNSIKHYGRYVNTPIEGIDYILDKVIQTSTENNIDSIALPLLGTGYANIDIVVDNPELRLLVSDLVLALTIHKLEEHFARPNNCIKRGVIVIFSRHSQSPEEHHIWDFAVKLLGKEHMKRADQIQKLIEGFNAKRNIGSM